jgi:hypothetical protein
MVDGMRSILLVVVIAVAGGSSRAEADSDECKMTVEAKTHPVSVGKQKSVLKLVTVAPASGSLLHQGSVLAVDLEYWIEDFEPGRFTIIPQFAESPERGTAGDFPDSGLPILTSPAGRVHFCFPVSYVWNEHLEVPIQVHFLLNKFVPNEYMGDHWTSVSVASTRHLSYPSFK